MPKLFPKSVTLAYRVLSSTNNPNRITYYQEQEYTIRGLGIKKVIQSTVVIDLDENDKIIHLHDKWNGEEHPTKWGVLVCYIHYRCCFHLIRYLKALRRLNAKTLPWFVSVPKLQKHE
jgi:hypothetical protein